MALGLLALPKDQTSGSKPVGHFLRPDLWILAVGTKGTLGWQRALKEVVKPAPACWDPLAYGHIHAENPAAKSNISSSLISTDPLEIGSTQSTKPSNLASVALIRLNLLCLLSLHR